MRRRIRRHLSCGLPARDDRLSNLTRVSSSFLRRPPMRPSALVVANPADVRSRITVRSNSEGADHLHHHLEGRRRGKRAGARKPAPASPIFSIDVQQVPQPSAIATADRASRPRDDVGLAGVVQQALQLGRFPAGAQKDVTQTCNNDFDRTGATTILLTRNG